MREEEKFDELIRSRLSEKEFLFDDENWEKAEVMLDSAKGRKATVKWSAIFLLGLFAGVGIMLPFVGTNNENGAVEVSKLTDKVKTRNEIAETSVAERESSKENGSVVLKQTSGGQTRKAEDIQREENEIYQPDKKNQKPKAFIAYPDKKAEALQPKVSTETILAETPVKEEVFASNEVIEKTNAVINKTDISDKEPKLISSPVPVQEKQIGNKEQLEIKATSGDLNSAPGGNKNAEEKSKQKDPSYPVQAIQTDRPSVPSQPIDKTIVVKTEEKTNSLSDETSKPDHVLVTTPVLKDSAADLPAQTPSAGSADVQADSSAVVSQSNSLQSPQPLAPSLASATIFSLDAGTNYGMGWSYHDTTEGEGFNPVFGIGIEHYFNAGWSLYSGIQYGSIAHLRASEKTFSSKTFDFGYKSIDTTVDTKQLYYAVFPIQLHYHFNNKNSIGIGGSISYLVNTRSDLIITPISGTSEIQKNKMGYYAGAFRQWDASLSVAYRRRLSDKFSISASATYGLIDIKSNAFFSRDKFERNLGLKLVLSYNLFDL